MSSTSGVIYHLLSRENKRQSTLPVLRTLEDRVFAEHRTRRRNRYGLMHCCTRNKIFSVRAQLSSALFPLVLDGWHKVKESPRELCVLTPVVLAHFFHHLLRDSGSGRRHGHILCTVAASEMMAFINMAVSDAEYYGVRVYFLVLDPDLYPAPDDLSLGGLGLLFCVPSAPSIHQATLD